eukprot:gene15153-16711_t
MANKAGSFLCIICLVGAFLTAASSPLKSKARPKTVSGSKKAFAKDFNMVGQDKKGCKYNDQSLSHGTIAYQDVCGKFICTDGYMAWYFFPNARMFDICHVPTALIRPDEKHLVMDDIPLYATKSTGDKMERVSVIGGPTHGESAHVEGDEHDHAHSAVLQTTTIDVKAAHEPHGQPTVEVHNPVTHTGAISITDHGGHHGEVVANTK